MGAKSSKSAARGVRGARNVDHDRPGKARQLLHGVRALMPPPMEGLLAITHICPFPSPWRVTSAVHLCWKGQFLCAEHGTGVRCQLYALCRRSAGVMKLEEPSDGGRARFLNSIPASGWQPFRSFRDFAGSRAGEAANFCFHHDRFPLRSSGRGGDHGRGCALSRRRADALPVQWPMMHGLLHHPFVWWIPAPSLPVPRWKK